MNFTRNDLTVLGFVLGALGIGILEGCATPAVAPTSAPPTSAPVLVQVGVTVIATAPPLSAKNDTGSVNYGRQAVLRFYEVRTKADRSLDDSEWESISIGEALEQQIQVLQTLREKNCYWIFTNQKIQFDEWTVFGANSIEMYVTVREDADLYCNGKHDRGSYTSATPYRSGFRVERFSDKWFVTRRWRER